MDIFSELTIVIPAKNESVGLRKILPLLKDTCTGAEIIVVNDGSTDDTAEYSLSEGVQVLSHPYSKGNGAAVKSGARMATRDWIVFIDGDGQHSPDDIIRLAEKAAEGYDMVVGARQGVSSQASFARWSANTIYNWLASWMVNRPIPDLTSGLRMIRRQKFMEFLYLLPNGFSYPTTTTMAFFRAGYSVGFVPIQASRREGKSHINPMRDGVRFLLIILKVGSLYSPLKIFLPISF
ncbi:MAG: glycosyltransferase involved in cell wall biosynthesis, partial [Halieaceae bacterium]